ncbi:hypothetical protein H310_09509 [Aphanomyces invadans]|uniref:DDE-1 domain-containing protein n=1 Tax=Aphanomyces invadans TaxID=157072 RepID=A0A024TUB0_9STRA|nr:hypothetical protein H310_09509 [Aphanomyces invadans]ETV97613.1 hypothetical protein H310_09509 [Aphanomyces invadans]|eukprot:XP_008873822.1 hypothetical protein H310_09509 [Aphanomyces invadans]
MAKRLKMVVLQRDNARAHVTPMDEPLKAAFDEYGTKGWTFSLALQPPNSPDTNILDLGFFAAIQSLQQKKLARSIDELVANGGQAFDDYAMESLACLVETMRLFGDNTNKLPHKGKECPPDAYDTCTCKEKLAAQHGAAMERAVSAEASSTSAESASTS